MHQSQNHHRSPFPANGRTASIIVGVAVMFSAGGGAISQTALDIDALETAPAEVSRLMVTVDAQGQIDCLNRTRVESRCYWSTRILKIVPQGTWVRKGDIVCELDSAELREDAEERKIRYVRAQSDLDSAQTSEMLQEIENQRREEAARVRKDQSEDLLDEYENGEYPRDLFERKTGSRLAQEVLEQSIDQYEFAAELSRHGFGTQSECDQAESDLSQARIDLDIAEGRQDLLTRFESQRQFAELRGDADQAKRELIRTNLRSGLASTQTRINTLSRERRLLTYKTSYEQAMEGVRACTIRAPHDGQVIHANSWTLKSMGYNTIEEGARVRYRQEIFSLPDLHVMQVETFVPEASWHAVVIGQPVQVRIAAFPDRVFQGRVSRIARIPTPQSYYMPGVKEFRVQVIIDTDQHQVGELAPRTQADLRIVVADIEQALQVPTTAIEDRDGEYFVYVKDRSGVGRRRVKLGATDDKTVQILSGIDAGVQVVRKPNAHLRQIVDHRHSTQHATVLTAN